MQIAMALVLPMVLLLVGAYLVTAIHTAWTGRWPEFGDDADEADEARAEEPPAESSVAARLFGIVWVLFELAFFLFTFAAWVDCVAGLLRG